MRSLASCCDFEVCFGFFFTEIPKLVAGTLLEQSEFPKKPSQTIEVSARRSRAHSPLSGERTFFQKEREEKSEAVGFDPLEGGSPAAGGKTVGFYNFKRSDYISNNQEFVRMDFPKGMELPSEYFQNIALDVGNEHLTGVKVAKDFSQPSDFVFLHGARGGNWSRVMTFAKPMVERGTSLVAFDHSGHGTSSGEEKNSSLQKKFEEACAVIDVFVDKKPKTLCGSSMGAYVAVKLLEKYDAQNLILYCPALYDQNAFTIPFNSRFTDIIRRQDSWRNTDAGKILQKFQGNLLVIIGSEDTVIPNGVIQLIEKSTGQVKRKEIIRVSAAPHAIHSWMVSHPALAQEIAQKVAEFSA